MNWPETGILSVADVFFIHIQSGESHYVDRLDSHQLKYVIKGEMTVFDGDAEITVSEGESLFLRKDHRISIRKYPLEEGGFKCITFVFTRNFLRKYYHEAHIQEKLKHPIGTFERSSLKLTDFLPLRSLFLSMLPYYEADALPEEGIMRLKMREAVHTLLLADERFYPVLFDFAETWKIDILDYLNENYMYNLSLSEIANYTGRSLATFKRDFAKLSELSPEKWIVAKRLDVAYRLLESGQFRIAQVMSSVGFINKSHFTAAFKRRFNKTPSDIINNRMNLKLKTK